MPDLFFGDATSYTDSLPVLATERLSLRPLTADDDAGLLALFSDERSLETWFRWRWSSLDDARAFRARLQEGFARRNLFVWGAIAPAGDDGDDLVGIGILTRWAPLHRRIDVGYYLASRRWGRGYATELTRALLAFAYESLRVHRVEAEVVPGNHASVRVLLRLGFVHEARLKERLWDEDTPLDCDLYRLFRPEFEAAR